MIIRNSLLLLLMVSGSHVLGQLPLDNWPVIRLDEEPPVHEPLALEPVWSLDCGVDSEVLVGRIVAAAPGPAGGILLLDSQMGRVIEMDADGEVVRFIGQPGNGPGDWPGAYRVARLTDGRIGVCGGARPFILQVGGFGKIVFLDGQDDPAGVWMAAGEAGGVPVSSVRELRCAGDRILVATQGMQIGERGMSRREELALLTAPKGDRRVLARRDFVEDMQCMVFEEDVYFEPFAHGRCDISGAGLVAFAPERDRWRVVIGDPDGAGHILTRDWAPRERTTRELARVRKEMGGGDAHPPARNHPPVGRIRWRPDGCLWVEPGGDDPAAGCLACFDELGPGGDLRRRVHLEVPDAMPGDELLLLEDGRFLLLRGLASPDESGEEAPGPEVRLLAARGG